MSFELSYFHSSPTMRENPPGYSLVNPQGFPHFATSPSLSVPLSPSHNCRAPQNGSTLSPYWEMCYFTRYVSVIDLWWDMNNMDKAAMVKGASEEVGVSVEEPEMLPRSFARYSSSRRHFAGHIENLQTMKSCCHQTLRCGSWGWGQRCRDLNQELFKQNLQSSLRP